MKQNVDCKLRVVPISFLKKDKKGIILLTFLAVFLLLLIGCGGSGGGGGGGESSDSPGDNNENNQAVCGNNIHEEGEQCEPGRDEYCNPDTCQWNRCGDGIVNAYYVMDEFGSAIAHKEECDIGGGDTENCNGVSESNPMASCIIPTCGDGHYNLLFEGDNPQIDNLEKGLPTGCDDGNPDNYDGCTDTCKWEGCGDGITQPYLVTGEDSDGNILTEECDDKGFECSRGDCQTKYSCDWRGRTCIVYHEEGTEPCAWGHYYQEVPKGGTILEGYETYSREQIIVCPGEFENKKHILVGYATKFTAYDAPIMRTPTTLYDKDPYYRNFVGTCEMPYVPSSTDTIIRAGGAEKTNIFYVRHAYLAASYNDPAHSYIMGFVLRDNRGTCRIQTEVGNHWEDSPCAAIREYCSSYWFFHRNVIINNDYGIYIRDHAPSWEFETSVKANVITKNGTGIRLHYGNSVTSMYNVITQNTHGVVTIDGRDHNFKFNTFGNNSNHVSMIASQYPKSIANDQTRFKYNNFLGYGNWVDDYPGYPEWHFRYNYYENGNYNQDYNPLSHEEEWYRYEYIPWEVDC